MDSFVNLCACSAPFKHRIYKMLAFLQRHIHEFYLFKTPRNFSTIVSTLGKEFLVSVAQSKAYR